MRKRTTCVLHHADEVDAVLHLIQQFDPAGVAARDLRENLELQLARYAPDTPWLKEARALLEELA